MPLREEDIKPITATPEWQLARELADPRVGKTEREHYAARRIADLELALRKIHDRAHSWNNIPACSDIEQIAFAALGLKDGA